MEGSSRNKRDSELFGTIELSKISIEGTERQMSRFASDFKEKTIRESDRGLATKFFESSGHGFGVLNCQVLVVQQHFDSGRDLGRFQFVNRSQHPCRFGQCKVGHPSALFEEVLGGDKLSCIVSSDYAHQNIGVNGAHGVSSCKSEYPL